MYRTSRLPVSWRNGLELVSTMAIEGTVYIVDDDDAVRDSLQALLDAVGLRSEAYASGDQFLEADLPPGSGAVLLDLKMPGLSGIDVLNLLARDHHPNPVIVITAHAEPDTVSQAIEAGAIAVLEKPLQKTLLIDTIRRVL
jgi:two-component system response regulator FixJ